MSICCICRHRLQMGIRAVALVIPHHSIRCYSCGSSSLIFNGAFVDAVSQGEGDGVGFPLQLAHLHLHGRAEQASKTSRSILENLTFLFHEMAEEGMGPASGVAPVTRVVEVVEEITLNRPATRSPEEDEDQADAIEDDLSFDYVVKEADEEMEEETEAAEERGGKFEYEVKEADEEVVEEVAEEIFTYVVKDVDQDQHSEQRKLIVDAKQVLMCQYCKTELTDESEAARARHRAQCAKYQEFKAAAEKDAVDSEDKADDDAYEIADSSDEEEADAEAEEDAEGDGQEEGNEEPVDEDVVPTDTTSSPIPGDTTQQDGDQHKDDVVSTGDDGTQETKQSPPISSVTSQGNEQQDAQQEEHQDGPHGEDPQAQKPDYSARLRSRKTQQSTPDGDISASSLLVEHDPPQASDDHYRYFVDDVGKLKAECLKCGKVYQRHTRRLQDHLAACDKPKDANKDPDDSATDDEIPAHRPKPTPAGTSPSAPAASKRPRQTPQKQNGERPKKTPALGKRKKAAPPSTPRRPPAAKRLKLERKPAVIGSAASSASKSASQSAKPSTASTKPQLTAPPHASSASEEKPDAAAIEDHLMQFEPTDGTRKVRCKHCGSQVALQRKMPGLALERHLKDCKELAHRLQQGVDLATQLAATSHDQDEAMELLGQAILDKQLAACVTNTSELDPYSTLVWLAGSVGNASTLKSHYGRSATVVHGPSRRFERLVDQQLHALDIPLLLTHVHTPVTGFVGPTEASRAAIKVDSQAATALYHQGFALVFSAPTAVCKLLAPPLAIDRGLGPQWCEASVVCGRASHLDWQCHRMDAICIQLRGETTWRVKKGVVRHPLRCVHPMQSPTTRHDASHAADLLTQMHQEALDPEEENELTPPKEDEANPIHEAVTEAGSVVYLPAGTWFATESANDAVWLELRMGSANYAQWLLDSVKHMLWRSPKWRASAITETDLKAVRSHVGDLLQDMQHLVASLTPADLLPEYLGIAAAHLNTGQQHEWDLTHQHFTGSRHVRVLQSSHFCVNPLARLTSLDEGQAHGPPLAAPVATQPAKALSKQRRNLKALAPVPARVYVLYLLGGEALFEASNLRVQFSCNAFQVALVEWIRGHSHRGGSSLFTSSDVAAVLQQQVGKAVSPDDDAVKDMLRFLCFAGYLTLVKATS